MSPVDGFAFSVEVSARSREARRFEIAEGYAESSWWIGLPRDQFYAQVRQHQARLTRSRFGRTDMLTTGRNEAPPQKRESMFGEEDV